MGKQRLTYLVLYSLDPQAAVRFYELLGLTFAREQHGSGPEHFAAILGQLVLELYPYAVAPSATPPAPLRLGITIPSVSVVQKAAAAGHPVLRSLRKTPRGRIAVLRDPDGRDVEVVVRRSK